MEVISRFDITNFKRDIPNLNKRLEKPLSDSTLNGYYVVLETITKGVNETNVIKALRKTQQVVDVFKAKYSNQSSLRNQYKNLFGVVKNFIKWNSYLKDERSFYLEHYNSIEDKYQAEISVSDFKIPDILKDTPYENMNMLEVETKMLEHESKIQEDDEYFGDDLHVIFGLYSLIPTRRVQDYREMRIIRLNEIPQATDKNYVKIFGNYGELYISDYKEFKRLGVYQRKITGRLFKILSKYAKDKKNKYVVQSPRQKPYSQPEFTKEVKSAYSILTGLDLSVNALRHIHGSTFYMKGIPTETEMRQFAFAMGNTVQTNLKYRLGNTAAEHGTVPVKKMK